MSAAARGDRLVIGATALLRYLPETLRGQLGLTGHWSSNPLTAAMREEAVGSIKAQYPAYVTSVSMRTGNAARRLPWQGYSDPFAQLLSE